MFLFIQYKLNEHQYVTKGNISKNYLAYAFTSLNTNLNLLHFR